MKTVRFSNGVVIEVIPAYALPVEAWYGLELAKSCTNAPDNVDVGWTYDANTKTFSRPPNPEETQPPANPMDEIRLAVAELAETESQRDLENKLAIAELAEKLLGGTT